MDTKYKHDRNSLDFANLCGDKMFYIIAYIESTIIISCINMKSIKHNGTFSFIFI